MPLPGSSAAIPRRNSRRSAKGSSSTSFGPVGARACSPSSRRHRRGGRRIALLSGIYQPIREALARRIDAEAYGKALEMRDGRATGRRGEPNSGATMTRRLREIVGDDALVAAYGHTEADLSMLALAAKPVAVAPRHGPFVPWLLAADWRIVDTGKAAHGAGCHRAFTSSVVRRTLRRAMSGARADPLLRRELPDPWLLAARLAAVALALVAVALFVRSIPFWIAFRSSRAREVATLAPDDLPFEMIAVAVIAAGLVSAIVWLGLATLIFWRRSRDGLGLLLVLGFVALGLILRDPGAGLLASDPDPWLPLIRTVLWTLNALALPWVFAFPDGRFVPRWSVALAAAWALWSLLRIPFPAELSHTRYGVAGAFAYVALPVASVACQIYRFRYRSNEAQRHQLKWFLYGGTLVVATWATLMLVPPILRLEPGPGTFLYLAISRGVLALASTALPIVVTIAIFRQGLLDIDLIINRTVAYGALTGSLVAVFVALSVLVQRAFTAITGAHSDFVALAVALPVAVAFVPLRARVEAMADRFVSDRTVLTVLFVDISASTQRAATLGDHAWRELLERFRAVVRRELKRFGGHEVDTAGDGFFVTFDGPGRAIRCAAAIVGAVRPLGIAARAGLHIGECELYGGKVSGISVHVGARVVAEASPGEVLVSRTLRDLVAGSDIRLRDRGLHALKGVPDRWQLYAVERA